MPPAGPPSVSEMRATRQLQWTASHGPKVFTHAKQTQIECHVKTRAPEKFRTLLPIQHDPQSCHTYHWWHPYPTAIPTIICTPVHEVHLCRWHNTYMDRGWAAVISIWSLPTIAPLHIHIIHKSRHSLVPSPQARPTHHQAPKGISAHACTCTRTRTSERAKTLVQIMNIKKCAWQRSESRPRQ